MRLATWNVRHSWHPGTGEADPGSFAAVCAGLAVDVLALQEVDRGTARVGGADLLALAAEATGLTPVDGAVVDLQGGTYGNALLVRGDPVDVEVLALPRRWWPPWKRPERRGAVRCRLLAGGPGGLVVATCHLGFDRGEGQGQLDATLRWLDGVDGPAVLLGDLNLRRPRVAAPWSLVDVPAAFPADAPDRVIDHVVTRGVTVRPTPDAGRPAVSDHRPVIVDLDSRVPASRQA